MTLLFSGQLPLVSISTLIKRKVKGHRGRKGNYGKKELGSSVSINCLVESARRQARNFMSLMMRSSKRCLFPVNSKMDQERGKLKYKSNHADSMPAEVLKA